ncbi:LapA family protein [Lysinibacillus sp. LZ02]|uniref:LapA family protein n=1 Tax=Lysinibacillus sp. LZ02 TaxID=3420668 RepID=UPI003D36FBCF
MKIQWTILAGLLFALMIAVFAYVNIEKVSVNYVFGKAEWPLIFIVLGSAFIGMFISACFSAVRLFAMKYKLNQLKNELHTMDRKLTEKNAEYISLKLQMSEMQEKFEREFHNPFLK